MLIRCGQRSQAPFTFPARPSAEGQVFGRTTRNVVVSGELVPTTANFGQNLYVGQACTLGDGSYGCSFVRLDPEFFIRTTEALADDASGS